MTGILTAPRGKGYTARLQLARLTSADMQVSWSLTKAATGTGQTIGIIGRAVPTVGEYRAKAKISAKGVVTAQIVRTVKGVTTVLAKGTVKGITWKVGTSLRVRFQVVGTGTTQLKLRIWNTAATEPAAWTLTSSDKTKSLQAKGGLGLRGYTSGSCSSRSATFRFDNFVVVGA